MCHVFQYCQNKFVACDFKRFFRRRKYQNGNIKKNDPTFLFEVNAILKSSGFEGKQNRKHLCNTKACTCFVIICIMYNMCQMARLEPFHPYIINIYYLSCMCVYFFTVSFIYSMRYYMDGYKSPTVTNVHFCMCSKYWLILIGLSFLIIW